MSPRAAAAPRTRTADAPAPPSRLSTVLVCGVLMLATLMAVLLLNIALSRGSYTQAKLAQRQTLLAEQEQQLSQQLDDARAPGVLDARAKALGMVPDPDPGYLRLSDGAVLGAPTSASTPSAAPSATAASSPTPSTPSTSSTSRAGGAATPSTAPAAGQSAGRSSSGPSRQGAPSSPPTSAAD
jgi:hypothetical protein